MTFNSITFVGLVAGSVFTYFGWENWQSLKEIKQTPRSTVRGISIGKTELHGRIKSKKPIQGPLSDKECACYGFLVEEQDENRWQEVTRRAFGNQVWLQDETGAVPIRIDGLTVEDGHKTRETSSMLQSPSDEAKNHLKRMDYDHETILGTNKSLRYTEIRLDQGDDVYLLGTARDNPDVEDGTVQEGHKDIIIEDDKNNEFIIAQGSEANLAGNKQTKAYSFLALGIFFITLAITVFFLL